MLAFVGLLIYKVLPEDKYKRPVPLFAAVSIAISAAPPGELINKVFPLVLA